jgi:hypothetical protein
MYVDNTTVADLATASSNPDSLCFEYADDQVHALFFSSSFFLSLPCLRPARLLQQLFHVKSSFIISPLPRIFH